MSLGQHLLEFRRRLFISAGAVLVGAVGGFFTADWVWGQLREPLKRVAAEQGRTADVSYTYVTEAFDTRLQIAFIVALIIASPVWLYQIWAFFMPALHRHEKRLALGFILTAVPLFLAGCYVGWVVLPNMVTLLVGFASEDAPSLLQAKTYLDFTAKLLIAVGIAFVLPVFLVLLNVAGVITAKQILGGWRVAIVLIATFAALATPAADVVSMFILMGAMIVLYFAAAAIAWLHDRRAARRLDAMTGQEAMT
ncbi:MULTISPECIES: twin-arginine translocase subunit TatC [unclassified Salinibacterium]|uniref:twin-arginine translocase subunit TatC n=1 Tax=Salinibacterium sp. GXW1014 TaxID=3377838 RepID=UPI0019EBE4F4|nr:twin-arginine translocase subunit TatC [Salinibacterium sp.]MBF0671015.1 twin-arginine translocase subunit TatC [Salinibacterium sp.]